MSEKKATPQAKASKKSAGLQRSGGTVPHINCAALEKELNDSQRGLYTGARKVVAGFKKARALIHRAARNRGESYAHLGKM